MRHPCSDLRARVEAKLVEDLFYVPLCRPAGDEEPASNLAIGQPSPHEAGDLHLAGCKTELDLPTQSAQPEASLDSKQPVPLPVVLGVTPPPISLTVPKDQAFTVAFDPIGRCGRGRGRIARGRIARGQNANKESPMNTLTRRVIRLVAMTVGAAGLLIAVNAVPGAATPPSPGSFTSQLLDRGTYTSDGTLPIKQGMDIVVAKITV